MVVNVDGLKAKKGGQDEKRAAAAEAVDEESIADMRTPDAKPDEEARARVRTERESLALREGMARLGGLKHMLDVARLTAKGSREITTAEAFNEHVREFSTALHHCLIGGDSDG